MKSLALLVLLAACSDAPTATVTPPDPIVTLHDAETELYAAVAAAELAHVRAWKLGSRLGTAFIWSDTSQAPQYILLPMGR